MSIVLHLGNNVKEYRKIANQRISELLGADGLICPFCGITRLKRNTSYPRSVLEDHTAEGGTATATRTDVHPDEPDCTAGQGEDAASAHHGVRREEITIVVAYCDHCKKHHALLPDFLSPHKQYSANEIEAAVIDGDRMPVSEIETVASESTVRRWITEAREGINRAVSVIKAHLANAGCAISDLRFVGMTGYETLAALLDALGLKRGGAGSVLGRANAWLAAERRLDAYV